MRLPFLISVPHAGLIVPPEIKSSFLLSKQQIIVDSDEWAKEIYDFADQVEFFISTPVARAVIDLNRKADDFTKDGVIKTHSCQMDPVYSKFPDNFAIAELIEKYYAPYHKSLTHAAQKYRDVCVLGLDCHTMLEISPLVSKEPGIKRPRVCLSHSAGIFPGTCPDKWIEVMKDCFIKHFGVSVKINAPL